MPDCEANIHEVEGRYGVAHQWVIGPVGDEDPSFYTGEVANMDCIAQAAEEITTPQVTVAFYGNTNASNYNGEWHWQAVVVPLEIFDEIVGDLNDSIGYYTQEEALQQLAERLMPDREWAGVTSVSIMDHLSNWE